MKKIFSYFQYRWKHLGFKVARFMARVSTKMKWLFVCIILIVTLATIFRGDIGKFVSDMISPVGMSQYLKDTPHNNGNWLTVVAYLIGLFFFTGIFISLITNYLRDAGARYRRGTLNSYHWSGHVLFLGFDELMMGTLKQASKKYHNIVVALPSNVESTRFLLEKYLDDKTMKNVEMVQCNSTLLSDLTQKACISTAARIYIIGMDDEPTHDAQNLKALAIIANHLKTLPENNIPRIMVYLRNQSTFSLLQRQGFNAENLWGMIGVTLTKVQENENLPEQLFLNRHCEYFNFHCDKALRMLSSPEGIHPYWPSDKKNLTTIPDGKVHLVVIGITKMGTALVREAIKLAHTSGRGTRFRITMVDNNAYEQMHYFIGRTKELFERCHYSFTDYKNPSLNIVHIPTPDFLDVEFEFIQCDVAHPRLTENLACWGTHPKHLLSIVICTDNSPKNMAAAMYLPPALLSGDNAVPVWIYQNGDESMKLLLDTKIYGSLHPFSLFDHVVEDTATSPIYHHARRIAAHYNDKYGVTYPPVAWEDTPSADRWSSIYSVLSMEIKLRAVGYTTFSRNIIVDTEEKKYSIDCIEHNRWVIEKLSTGFIPTNDTQHQAVEQELEQLKRKYPDWEINRESRKKIEEQRKIFNQLKSNKTNNGIRIHDDIRPFNALDEYTRRKDRVMLDDYIAAIESQQ